MCADLDTRLREALSVPEPPAWSWPDAWAVLDGTPAPAPRRTRRRLRSLAGTVAVGAGIAGLTGVLVMALPRGERAAPAQQPHFSVLERPAPAQVPVHGLVARLYRESGIVLTTLRVARNPATGDDVLVGRNRAGQVCLAVRERRGVTGVACAAAADVAAGALVMPTITGHVVLVPDDTRVTIPGEAATPRVDNVMPVPARAERIVVVRGDGGRRMLTLGNGLAMTASDRAAVPATVPRLADVGGVRMALGALETARLTGSVTPQPTAGVTPGTVLSQEPAAGASLAPGSRVGIVVATPVGPGGVRTPLTLPRTLRLTRGNGGSFRAIPSTLLRGEVRVVAVATDAATARGIVRASTLTVPAVPDVVVTVGPGATLAARTAGIGAWVLPDADGRLARTVGLPRGGWAALDREGRVAARWSAQPTSAVLGTVLDALAVEPPRDLTPPAPPDGGVLASRDPIAVEDIPTTIAFGVQGVCRLSVRSVWGFGPTDGGASAWIGVAPGLLDPDQWLIVTGKGGGGTCGGGSVERLGGSHLAVAASSGGPSTQLFLVAAGYDHLTLDGRTYPVRNGLAETARPNRGTRTVRITGPAGTRTVPITY